IEWRAGAGHHDGDGEFHVAVTLRLQTSYFRLSVFKEEMASGFHADVSVDDMGGQGGGLRAANHVDVVDRRRDRAHFYLHAGAQSVETLCTPSRQAPQ